MTPQTVGQLTVYQIRMMLAKEESLRGVRRVSASAAKNDPVIREAMETIRRRKRDLKQGRGNHGGQ